METTLATADEPNLDTMKRVGAILEIETFREKILAIKTTADTLQVTSIEDKSGMKLARQTRLSIRELRIGFTEAHKTLKADALKRCQTLDNGKRELLALCEPLEERLDALEHYAEREIARQEEETKLMREEELQPFGVATQFIDLAKMPADDYAALFQSSKAAHEAKLAAAAKEEADRVAKEEAERLERARVIAENIRLKEEAAKAEAIAMAERVKAESERKAAETRAAAALKAEQDKAKAAAAKSKAEADERDRMAAEALAKERAEAAERERVIRERAIEAQRIADENTRAQAAKAAAAEKELTDKRAAEQAKIAAALAEQEAAAKAPDKEKLTAFASTIIAIEVPTFATAEGKALEGEINDRINALAEWLNQKAKAL